MNAGPIKRALISVSDKTGVVEFARALAGMHVEILSTGGTARLLTENGIAVTEVSDHTGMPEMMGGRLKTLHPKIHGGVLARRGIDEAEMAAAGITPIDLVAVNLYPFERAAAEARAGVEAVLEQIDIGGAALLRAAAKNFAAVTVVVEAADYTAVIEEMRAHGGAVSEARRMELAAKAFAHTARYDGRIAEFLGRLEPGGGRARFARTYNLQLVKVRDMRYGENPHQAAAFYRDHDAPAGTVAAARQVHGKALSFNNIADADAALECVKQFTQGPACVIVKHGNPCGAALASDPVTAYERAHATDPTAAFGGIVAFNRPLHAEALAAVLERQFVEVVVAPEVDARARAVAAKKPDVRVLACGAWTGTGWAGDDFRRVGGGLLVQERDLKTVTRERLRVVTKRAPTDSEIDDLLFAWRVCRFVKSNAIVYARGGRTLGIGAGQMSRVDSARLAIEKAARQGHGLAGAAMASDAFLPFADSLEIAAEAGVRALIQPGGSKRDEEVIAAADARDMAMVFTGVRHFRH